MIILHTGALRVDRPVGRGEEGPTHGASSWQGWRLPGGLFLILLTVMNIVKINFSLKAWLLEAIIVAMELYLEEAEATVVTVTGIQKEIQIQRQIEAHCKYKIQNIGDVKRSATCGQRRKSSSPRFGS